MLDSQEKKYDVALSFLKEDEDLAAKLNNYLQDRLSIFLYSKRQGEIAGTDGEKTFNEVFCNETRIVVVLYREGWGQTPWTRIEETAIRNRAYEEGYDFVIFVPLDKPPKVPKWLPKSRIWIGLERWGIEGAASVIESKVQEAGGTARQETIDQRAIRLKRRIDEEIARKQFLDSKEGVMAARKEIERLKGTIETLIQKVKTEGFIIETRSNDKNTPQWIEIIGNRFSVNIEWYWKYTNTQNGFNFKTELWKGVPPRENRYFSKMDGPQKLSQQSYCFDLNAPENYGWREHDKSRLLSSQELVERYIQLLIDLIYRDELGNRI